MAVLLAVGGLTLATAALARPGGGQSYGGGSRSSGSSGGSRSYSSGSSYSGSSYSGSGTTSGSGGGGLLVLLLVEYPMCGWPLVLGGVGIWLYGRWRRMNEQGSWSTGEPQRRVSSWTPPDDVPQPPPPSKRGRLSLLRTVGPPVAEGQPVEPFDPDFSLVLFEDFVYALYAKVHQARATGVGELAAYVTPQVREALVARGSPQEVSNIVIGAMKYLSVSDILPGSGWVHVKLEFEANYTERTSTGEQAYWVVERFRLKRSTKVRSRPPDKARVLDCPNCGAALSEVRDGVCQHCGQRVDTGAFHWVIDGYEAVRKDARAPQLTGFFEEVGTDLRTLVSGSARGRLDQLAKDDPNFSFPAFEQRVRLTYDVMNDAWTSLQWEKARAFLSDNLYEMQTYWIEAYRKQGLRNQLVEMRVSRVELAKVVRDRHYDAITVRLFASGFDFTETADGRLVGGNKRVRRAYSEYWTFIRGTGVKHAVTTEKKCPNCGGPLQINMAGACEFCQAKVTSGQFDWVLSRIEQDEAYGG